MIHCRCPRGGAATGACTVQREGIGWGTELGDRRFGISPRYHTESPGRLVPGFHRFSHISGRAAKSAFVLVICLTLAGGPSSSAR